MIASASAPRSDHLCRSIMATRGRFRPLVVFSNLSYSLGLFLGVRNFSNPYLTIEREGR